MRLEVGFQVESGEPPVLNQLAESDIDLNRPPLKLTLETAADLDRYNPVTMPHSVVFRLSLLSSHSEGEIGSASHKEGNEPSFARLTILYSRTRLIPKPIYCGAGPAALDGNCGPAAPNGNGGRSYQANKHRWSRR
eukprot:g21318.t1